MSSASCSRISNVKLFWCYILTFITSVLVRCDLDVPMKNGVVTDDSLLHRSLATIIHLSGKGAKVILAAHRGTPTGSGYDAQLSMGPVAARLSELLGREVPLIPDCVGLSVGRGVAEMAPGGVVLLENLRFYVEEGTNDEDFVKNLASQTDIFVHDAFSAAGHSLASTEGVASVVPLAVCGLALKKELDFLQHAVQEPVRPFVAIVSGSELSSQEALFTRLLHKVDKLVVSGAVSSAFLKARGENIPGSVVVDEDQLGVAKRLDQLAAQRSVPVLTCGSADTIQSAVNDAKTVLWVDGDNTFEYSDATAHAMAAVTEQGAVTVVVANSAPAAKVSHVSVCDKNALELLNGNEILSIASLNNF